MAISPIIVPRSSHERIASHAEAFINKHHPAVTNGFLSHLRGRPKEA